MPPRALSTPCGSGGFRRTLYQSPAVKPMYEFTVFSWAFSATPPEEMAVLNTVLDRKHTRQQDAIKSAPSNHSSFFWTKSPKQRRLWKRGCNRCRQDMAHMRQTRPDFDLGGCHCLGKRLSTLSSCSLLARHIMALTCGRTSLKSLKLLILRSEACRGKSRSMYYGLRSLWMKEESEE